MGTWRLPDACFRFFWQKCDCLLPLLVSLIYEEIEVAGRPLTHSLDPSGWLCSPHDYKALDNLVCVPGQCKLTVAELMLRVSKRGSQPTGGPSRPWWHSHLLVRCCRLWCTGDAFTLLPPGFRISPVTPPQEGGEACLLFRSPLFLEQEHSMCPIHTLQDCHGPTEWHMCFPRNTEFQGNVALCRNCLGLVMRLKRRQQKGTTVRSQIMILFE